jgi:hypothetical protein
MVKNIKSMGQSWPVRENMKIKFKTIRSGGNSFIKRFSIYLKNGSIKFHIFLDDDKDDPHSHP